MQPSLGAFASGCMPIWDVISRLGDYLLELRLRLFLIPLGFMVGLTPWAFAQQFPAQPVRMIVGFPPGGGTDIVARTVAQKLAEIWGYPVVVDNRAGANGIIGAELVSQAVPNGYTLLFSSAGALVISPNLGVKLSYDPIKDFSPISVISESAPLLVVNESVPVNSVKSLIALAKAKPGELTYGSSGIGGPNHMAGELFKSMAGVNMTHVPYKGSAPAVADLLGGQVKVMFGVIPALLPHVNTGKLKAIAVGGARRSLALPNLPTISEAGLPGYELSVWYGLLAPKNTQPKIISTLHGAIEMVLASKDVRTAFQKVGAEPVGNTPKQFASYINSEFSKYEKLVKVSGASYQ
jgi:tripartite-type tricarboxylate transporter receptor subunit TctC